MNNLIKIGIPSKGRLRNDILNIFKKKKLKLSSEKGKRDLVGYISGKKNIKIIYLHAREIIESFPRQALHAAQLSFIDPTTSKKVSFQSKLPSDLVELRENLLNQA